MEGFLDTKPILVKVEWADTEVELMNGEPTPYGLRAETRFQGGVTRWFVPWDAIAYMKQDIPDEPEAPDPVVPGRPSNSGGDGNGRRQR
jgi:hypothetical protein